MSDTPRTEKFLEGLWNPDIHGDFNHISDFARQLERELNEAKAELVRVTEERDALLAACKEAVPVWSDDVWQFAKRNPTALAQEITYGEAIMLRDAIAKVETGENA